MVNHPEDDGSLSGSGFTPVDHRASGASHTRDLKVEGCWELTAHRPEALFSRSFALYAGCIPSSPMRPKLLEWWRFWSYWRQEEEKSTGKNAGPGASLSPHDVLWTESTQALADHRLLRNSSPGDETGPQVPQLATWDPPNHQGEAEV